MILSVMALVPLFLGFSSASGDHKPMGKQALEQNILGSGIDPEKYKPACPDYLHYSVVPQYVGDLFPDNKTSFTLIQTPAGP